MKIFEKAAASLRRDRETLKTLSFPKKLGFIFDYYKGWFFVLFCLILLGCYIGEAVTEIRNETVLEGFFCNDDEDLFPAKKLARDFSAYLGLGKRQQVIFDDTLYVIPGSGAEYNTASQSKVVAYIAARELDFLVTTKELVASYAPSCPVLDLEGFLPEELLERLQDQLLYMEDGSGEYKACGVSLAGSRFTKDSEAQKESPHYLMAFSYSRHQDALLQFLRYAFEMES